MAIGDFFSGLGGSTSDYIFLGIILASLIGIFWYLRGKFKSSGSLRKEANFERKERRYQRRGWKKFLGGLLARKKIEKEEKKVEKTEEKIYVLETDLIESIQEIHKMINQYKAKPDAKLFQEIKAKSSEVLHQFKQILELLNTEEKRLNDMKESLEKWEQSIKKANLNLDNEIVVLEKNIKTVLGESGPYKVHKKVNLDKRLKYFVRIVESNKHLLQLLEEANEIVGEGMRKTDSVRQQGGKLYNLVLANRDLYKANKLWLQVTGELKQISWLVAQRKLQEKKNAEIDVALSAEFKKQEQAFAAIEILRKKFNELMEREKIEVQQEKQKSKSE